MAEAPFGWSRACFEGAQEPSFSSVKKEINSNTVVFCSQYFIVLNTLVGFTKIYFFLLTEKQTGSARLFLYLLYLWLSATASSSQRLL